MTDTGTGGQGGTGRERSRKSFAVIAYRLTPDAFRAFTLLEVMVAVMILGFVIVSLLGLKNRSMEDVMLAERMTSATLLAKRVMTETLMKTPVPVEEDGEFEEAEFKDFTWKKVVAPTPLPTVMEVRVAVLWKEGDRDEQVELVSYE